MKKLIAANWKMNPAPFLQEIMRDAPRTPYHPYPKVDVIVFPSALDIAACAQAGIVTGGQAARPESSGAFTGDLSMQMLKNAGCAYALCGHSDRRHFHGETDDFVAKQANAAIESGLIPIVCIGETIEERNAGRSEEAVKKQLQSILALCPLSTIHCSLVLAYEPVWAISRGNSEKPAAAPADAQAMHALIRSLLPKDVRRNVRILYGGSMKASNAKKLLSLPDVDGGLVGNASLNPEEFQAIVEAAAVL